MSTLTISNLFFALQVFALNKPNEACLDLAKYLAPKPVTLDVAMQGTGSMKHVACAYLK